MVLGIILQLTYAMSVSLTGIGAIMERKLGLVDRLSAARVTEAEMMLALIIVQCIIMSVQIAILYIMALAVFQTPFLGSIPLALFITYLQGLSGLCFGLIISSGMENFFIYFSEINGKFEFQFHRINQYWSFVAF